MDALAGIVAELQDRRAIEDCLMTYSRAIDRLDRDLLLSVYHEDAVDDHGLFVGSPAAFPDWAIALAASANGPALLEQSRTPRPIICSWA